MKEEMIETGALDEGRWMDDEARHWRRRLRCAASATVQRPRVRCRPLRPAAGGWSGAAPRLDPLAAAKEAVYKCHETSESA